jgi:hypothetical protein
MRFRHVPAKAVSFGCLVPALSILKFGLKNKAVESFQSCEQE